MEHAGRSGVEAAAAAILHQLHGSIEPNKQAAVGQRGRARDDAVVIPGIALRHHQRLAPSIGAAVVVGACGTAAVVSRQDCLADEPSDMSAAEAVIDLSRRVVPSPFGSGIAMAAVMADKCIALRQQRRAVHLVLVVIRRGRYGAGLPTSPDHQHLPVPADEGELDSEPHVWPNHAFNNACARYSAGAFNGRYSRDFRRCVLCEREIGRSQLRALLADWSECGNVGLVLSVGNGRGEKQKCGTDHLTRLDVHRSFPFSFMDCARFASQNRSTSRTSSVDTTIPVPAVTVPLVRLGLARANCSCDAHKRPAASKVTAYSWLCTSR